MHIEYLRNHCHIHPDIKESRLYIDITLGKLHTLFAFCGARVFYVAVAFTLS